MSNEKLKKNVLCARLRVVLCLFPRRRNLVLLLSIVAALLVSLVVGVMFISHRFKHIWLSDSSETPTKSFGLTGGTVSSKGTVRLVVPDVEDLVRNCSVASAKKSIPFNNNEWTTHPLWFPQYPDSLEENLIRSLVNSMTGLQAGAKSYYASSKLIKRCKAKNTETAICMNVYPVVDMKPGPEDRRDLFHANAVLVLRNPATVMPAFQNGKRIKYRKLPGQMPENEWRQTRDQWIEGMIEQWANTIRTWKATGYNIALYLVHEHMMMDAPGKGLEQVYEMDRILSTSGFPSALSREELACSYYQSIVDRVPVYQQHRYEYIDYLPGYTAEQKELILNCLIELMNEFESDDKLVAILQEYHDDVQQNLRIDIQFQNETMPIASS